MRSAGITFDQLGLPFTWRYGPSNRGIGDVSYATQMHAFTGVGLRPYAPVHIRGARNAGGDLTLSWIRRTRAGGDNWDASDVPLSEDVESYEIDIMWGATVKRTISSTIASAVYTAAQQLADFGAAQSSVTVRVYQMSARFGRGSPGTTIV